jgi:hypothetical protein
MCSRIVSGVNDSRVRSIIWTKVEIYACVNDIQRNINGHILNVLSSGRSNSGLQDKSQSAISAAVNGV